METCRALCEEEIIPFWSDVLRQMVSVPENHGESVMSREKPHIEAQFCTFRDELQPRKGRKLGILIEKTPNHFTAPCDRGFALFSFHRFRKPAVIFRPLQQEFLVNTLQGRRLEELNRLNIGDGLNFFGYGYAVLDKQAGGIILKSKTGQGGLIFMQPFEELVGGTRCRFSVPIDTIHFAPTGLFINSTPW